MKIQKWLKQEWLNPRWLNPNEHIDGSNIFWFWFAIGFLAVALIIVLNLVGDEIKWVDGSKETPLTQLRPDLTSAILSTSFMAALFIRKCIKVPEHPFIWVLIFGDLILVASFFNIIFSGKEIPIFTIPEWLPVKSPSVSPRFLAIAILVLTFIGVRPIAGLAAILLLFVTLLHLKNVDTSLEGKGWMYAFSSFVTLVVQTRIPGIGFDAIRSRQFLSDAGSVAKNVGGNLAKSIQSTGSAVKKIANIGTEAAMAYATGGTSIAARKISEKSKTENTKLLNEMKEKDE